MKVYLWVLLKKIASSSAGSNTKGLFSVLMTSLPPFYYMVVCVNRDRVVGNLNMESVKYDFAAA